MASTPRTAGTRATYVLNKDGEPWPSTKPCTINCLVLRVALCSSAEQGLLAFTLREEP